MVKIKNMEMPKSCRKCKFRQSKYDGYTCMFSEFDVKEGFEMDTTEYCEKRHEKCPLEEI